MVRIVRIVRWLLIVFLVVFISAQFIRPVRDNPPTPAGSLLGKATPPVASILDRACRDCHTNETRWPWYTSVTPTNWFIADHVHHGREHLNLSLWASYDEDEQDKFLGNMCDLAQRRRMPLPSYLIIHREAKLSDADVETLCNWTEKMRDVLQ
jgi:Haem-binding domain